MARLRVSRTSLLSVAGVRNIYDDSYFIEGDDRIPIRVSVRWGDTGTQGYVYYGMGVKISNRTVRAKDLTVSQPHPFMVTSVRIGFGGITAKIAAKWTEISISGKHEKIKVGEVFIMQWDRGIVARL